MSLLSLKKKNILFAFCFCTTTQKDEISDVAFLFLIRRQQQGLCD
jgi:hypothetical protein